MDTQLLHPLLEGLRPQGIRLGLERPRRLMAALGDPQTRFPTVLIAGTNGKGSTAMVLDAIVRAGGISTGLFTSPALETSEDQIRLKGTAITPGRLDALLRRVVEASPGALGGDPTPFEALTAAAFLAFAEAEVELAVVECGMGGARDATNVTDPVIAVLTSVGLEHRRFLGDTPQLIAREKAGVFRPGRPAVVGPLDPAARRVVVREADARGAELHQVEDEVEVARTPPGPEATSPSQQVELTTPVRRYRLETAPAGEHQVWNLALAVRTAELLAGGPTRAGAGAATWSRLDPDAVIEGIATCRLPGRLEWVALPGGRRVLLDVAHNPPAVAALVGYLETCPRLREDAGWDLLFGVLEDKEVAAMLPPLAADARRVTLTRPSDPRGRDPRELTDLLPPGRGAGVVPSPMEALKTAFAAGAKTLVVCGSVVLVGEVRRELRRGYGGLAS